jgi:peptidoglycan/xylan/chitin deacetylase (PgdA/CDA1 family)
MMLNTLWDRCRGRYQRTASARLSRRSVAMRNRVPIISFTFDDFPSSALSNGGGILEAHGVSGTYYASLGLMGSKAPTGMIFRREELLAVIERGHELGCHTFAHCHAFETSPSEFEHSIIQNRRALEQLVPGAAFKTLSYPIGSPRPGTKRRSAKYFLACRAGGQTYNAGSTDLNQLKAFFIEQSLDRHDAIRRMIDANYTAGGWLIFATHDVCEQPTQFGCTPVLFEQIVQHSVQSGARLLPVSAALAEIGVTEGMVPCVMGGKS